MTLNKKLSIFLVFSILSIFINTNLFSDIRNIGDGSYCPGPLLRFEHEGGLLVSKLKYDKEKYSIGDEMTVTIDFNLDIEKNKHDFKFYIPSLQNLYKIKPHMRPRSKVKLVSAPSDDLMLSNTNPTAQLTYKFMLTEKFSTFSTRKIENGNYLGIVVGVYLIIPDANMDLSNPSHLDIHSSSIYLGFRFKESIYKLQERKNKKGLSLKGNTNKRK